MFSGLITGCICDALFLYQLVASLATYILLRTAWFYRARFGLYELFRHHGIPGPKPNLFSGNCDIFETVPYTYEVDEALRNRYGKNFVLFHGDIPTLYVTDLEVLQEVFIKETEVFKDRSHSTLDTVLDHSVLLAKHKHLRLYRKVLSPSLVVMPSKVIM